MTEWMKQWQVRVTKMRLEYQARGIPRECIDKAIAEAVDELPVSSAYKAQMVLLASIGADHQLDITKTLLEARARTLDQNAPDILDLASVRQSVDSMTEMAALLGRLGVK